MSKYSRRKAEEMRQAGAEWDIALAAALRGLTPELDELASSARPAEAKLEARRAGLRASVGETVYDHYRLAHLQYFCGVADSEHLISEEIFHLAGLAIGLREENWIFEFDATERARVEDAIDAVLSRFGSEFLDGVQSFAGSRRKPAPAWKDWPLSYVLQAIEPS